MSTVTLSDTFHLLVPEDVRELLHLEPGTQFQLIPYNGRLEFAPIRPIQEYSGMFKGEDTNIERDEQDRL